MKRFKKALKLSGLVFLIVLASIGVSMGGGIPVPRSGKREDTVEIKIELVESKDDEPDLLQKVE